MARRADRDWPGRPTSSVTEVVSTAPRAACRRASLALAAAWALAGLAAQAGLGQAVRDISGVQVKRALGSGVRAILSRQLNDGTWVERYHAGGQTALSTLALLQAGHAADSRELTAAIAAVRRQANEMVYVVSLKIMVLAAADAGKHRGEIESGAKWLVAAQQADGLWSYQQGGATDHSNSQFALLGLHAASQAGVKIPPGVWQKARNGLIAHQNGDGGWSYRRGGESYGSMTAAGVADLLILGEVESGSGESGFQNGAAAGCGKQRVSKPLARGLEWLGKHFRAQTNPNHGDVYTYYWLYAVERCGILSGERFLGRRDWYREGAAQLVQAQRADGMWTEDIANTCFGVLFLAKGHKSLLIQKLRWSTDESWNPDANDVDHLVSFIGDRLGEPVAWQMVTMDAPLAEWLAAPILYFHGHTFPKWGANEQRKLREFVERGGIILAEACCGRDDFRDGFRRFAAETFPETPLRPLPDDHAVYTALLAAPAYALQGIDVGCRTSVIFSPNDLSCLWEQADVPALSERAFRIGANIAAMATGRQKLRDRLDLVVVPEGDAAKGNGLLPAGDALRLAQVVYEGDWRPDPLALVHFSEFMRDEAGIDVVSQYSPVRLTEAELRGAPLLFMTGHHGFSLHDEERAALRGHLERGGFLIAEACCGRAEFDKSFRSVIARVFPEAALTRLPPEHAIFRGAPGFDVSHVEYRPAVQTAEPGLSAPVLEGLELRGRLVLVYSPYALGCGLDGHLCHDCRGLAPADARRLTANIVLYALTH